VQNKKYTFPHRELHEPSPSIVLIYPTRKFNWRAFSKLSPQAPPWAPPGVIVHEHTGVRANSRTCVSFRSRLCASNRYRRGLPVHAPSYFSRVGMSFLALHSRM